MPPTIDPLVLGQMALGAIADLAFTMAVGAAWLGFDHANTRPTQRFSLLAWLAAEAIYLPLQAGTMSGASIAEAWPAIPVVLRHSHFGVMWMIGIAAGMVALGLVVVGHRTARLPLAAAMIVMAFAHAGATHAADAGDFSAAELVHMVHLLATAGWAGVVICAALPLRASLAVSAADSLANMRRLSRVATFSFAIAIVTGLANAYRGLGGSLAPLTTSLWGVLLLVKLVLVTAAVAIGGVNRLVHMKHFASGAFMNWLTIEACLMIGVLVAAAVLGHSIPGASA
jgi:copper resistance protein D